jgi:iron complex outermembrane receptor protein
VTAQRREERMQDVPVAISAFPELQLELRQIADLSALQFSAPNLVITADQTNRSAAAIAMRGQFESDSMPTVDPAVGVYLDGVYISRITGANLRLVDMERVEVLRGPQGTLFGRNTIGGAISLVPNRPSTRFEAYSQVVIGNYARRELTGMLNLSTAAGEHRLRIVAAHTEHDGYGESILVHHDLNDDDTDFVRAQVRIAGAERWDLNLSFDHTNYRDSGQLRTLLAAYPPSEGVTGASGHPDDDVANYVDPLSLSVSANRVGAVLATMSGAAAVLTVDSSRFTFKSITAERWLESSASDSDQDGTPYDLGAILRRDDEQAQFSQEFQANGVGSDERFNWIAGLYYAEERGSLDQQFVAFVPATGRWSENILGGDFRNESSAVYAQAGYALTPQLRVFGGMRLNEDRRQLTSRNARRVAGIESCRLDPELRDSPDVCQATLPERRFSYAPYVVGLDFRAIPETLLYAKFSRGHRAGGYNLRGATAVEFETFEPEQLGAFEVGVKSDLLGDRLRVNLALFRSKFDAIQLVQRETIGGSPLPIRYIVNGGEARIDGGELEVTAIRGALRLSGALGLIDPRYTRLDPKVEGVTLNSEFLQTPNTTLSMAADLPVELGFGQVDLHVDYAWKDDVSFVYDKVSPARQEAYGLWNAMIKTSFVATGVEVSLWGRNLADMRYFTRALNSEVYASAVPGDPRTYGVSIAYRFGGDADSRSTGKPL